MSRRRLLPSPLTLPLALRHVLSLSLATRKANIVVPHFDPSTCYADPPRGVFCPKVNDIRSVFKISCLFLRPRLWQFEI